MKDYERRELLQIIQYWERAEREAADTMHHAQSQAAHWRKRLENDKPMKSHERPSPR